MTRTILLRAKSAALACIRRIGRMHEWGVASLVVVFLVLLLIPSFSLSLRRGLAATTFGTSGMSPLVESIESNRPVEVKSVHHEIIVAAGDTLLGILSGAGIEGKTADDLIASLHRYFGPSDLQPGQVISLEFHPGAPAQESELAALKIGVDSSQDLEATRGSDGNFLVRVIPQLRSFRPVLVHGTITSTLYDSAIGAGLPVSVLMEMIRAFSFDVDFQRDVSPGSSYQVLFERVYDKSGSYVGDDSILSAQLVLADTTLRIYKYESSNGVTDYFNEKGQSVRKTLIRTPIEGAWISSGYGYRVDPIYGYTKFHPALDFAAPIGTPIMAAGDGVVEVAGYNSDFGNYVQIRHRNEYRTLYGHMRSFAKGVKAGARVTQGQIIGYVGLTGLTTGPHLHYEVMWRGEHVNPATVVSPPGPVLSGDELQRFQTAKKAIDDIERGLSAQTNSKA